MKLKSILRGPAGAVILVAAASALQPASSGFVDRAAAAVSVSFSVGTFYDRLSPYGSWTFYDGSYVFVPVGLRYGWRPYTVGHWVYTDRYGWLWVSDEPFGWATYHYGRWGFADDIGWYWVPGTRWAPAWVYWRGDPDNMVWAPLPPRRGNVDVFVNIGVNDIPDYYWCAVPTRSFLSVNIATVLIDDDNERLRIVRRAQPRGTVRITNNTVVNNVIDVNDVERRTNRKVQRVRVVEADKPENAKARGGDEIAVFDKPALTEANAKPKDAVDVTEVKKKRKARLQEQGVTEESLGATGESTGGKAGKQTEETQSSKNKNKAGATAVQPEVVTPEEQTQGKRAKKSKGEQPEVVAPEQQQQKLPTVKRGKVTQTEVVTPQDQQRQGKRLKKGNVQQGGGQGGGNAEQQRTKKKRVVPRDQQPNAGEQVRKRKGNDNAGQPAQQGKAKKKAGGNKGKPQCDPAVAQCAGQ
jgi:hypothetical protein